MYTTPAIHVLRVVVIVQDGWIWFENNIPRTRALFVIVRSRAQRTHLGTISDAHGNGHLRAPPCNGRRKLCQAKDTHTLAATHRNIETQLEGPWFGSDFMLVFLGVFFLFLLLPYFRSQRISPLSRLIFCREVCVLAFLLSAKSIPLTPSQLN